ncbi:hypothetical protein Franean1_4433 [Parafrankia sp. EAN1pec]|nr:hypothetical protein Franean1_4433 [Frankia sp. EAN1pec]
MIVIWKRVWQRRHTISVMACLGPRLTCENGGIDLPLSGWEVTRPVFTDVATRYGPCMAAEVVWPGRVGAMTCDGAQDRAW